MLIYLVLNSSWLSFGIFESALKLRGLGGVTNPPPPLPGNPLITSLFRILSCVVAAIQRTCEPGIKFGSRHAEIRLDALDF